MKSKELKTKTKTKKKQNPEFLRKTYFKLKTIIKASILEDASANHTINNICSYL